MKHGFVILLISISCGLIGQEKIVKTIKSDAPYVEVNTKGIDNLIIKESETDQLEMIITDKEGFGFVENLTCDDFNCVVNIKTELKEENLIHQSKVNFIVPPQSNVNAIVKIPKNKKVSIFGEIIDVQTEGYLGVLRILIDKGNIRIKEVKGITEVNLFAGTVFATIKGIALDIRTKKGEVLLNNATQKSPFRVKRKKAPTLIVKSINANVVLTEL